MEETSWQPGTDRQKIKKGVKAMPEGKKTAVVECWIESRISAKKGTQYNVLVHLFENGYKMDTFLNNEQLFIIGQVVPTLK